MNINMGYQKRFCENPNHLEEILTYNSHCIRCAFTFLISCALPPVKSLVPCTEELESY